jgi:salicylate hydroxylase
MHETDVVIGADGIKSTVRRAVVSNDLEVEAEGGDVATIVSNEMTDKSLVFMNAICYRGVVPMAKAKGMGVKADLTSSAMCWLGHDKVGISCYMNLSQD